MTRIVQITHELVGIEVLVGIENVADKHAPGLGELFPTYFEEFTELLDR